MEGQQTAAADRISELPVEILHTILSLLDSPKQAARASTLSKRWRDHIWPSFPFMEFRHSDFPDDTTLRHTFRRFAYAAGTRLPQLVALRIALSSYYGLRNPPKWANALNKLLESMAQSPSSPLEIALRIEKTFHQDLFILPRGMILKPRTQVLKLRGFDFGRAALEDRPVITKPLDGLRVLSLEKVLVQESVLVGGLLANAPNLELLSLDLILPGIEMLEVSFPNLKTLNITGQDSVRKVKLTAAPRLETLDIEQLCKLEVVSSSSAPVLSVVRIFGIMGFTQEELDFVSKLPALESLSFRNPIVNYDQRAICRSRISTRLRIAAGAYNKLREVHLTDFHRPDDVLQEIEIDAPNLVSLYYRIDTCSTKHPGKISIVGHDVVPSDCRRFVVDVQGNRLNHTWFLELREFLATLMMNQQLTSNLVLKLNCTKQHDWLSWEPFNFNQARYSFLPAEIEHLQLEAKGNCSDGDDILDACFWMCSPNLLSVTGTHAFPEHICRKIMNRELFRSSSNNVCWRHRLKDATITNREYSEEQKSITLMLTWRY